MTTAIKPQLLEINEELIREVENYSGLVPISTLDKAGIFLLLSFVKGYRTLNSILILCKTGNGQDAFMLVRTLFELAINTKYVFLKDTDKRLVLFDEYDYVLREMMINNIKKNKKLPISLLEKKASEQNVDLSEIKRRAKAHQATYNYDNNDRNTWSKKSIWQMAKDTKLDELYNTVYALGSQLIHSASRSFNEYARVCDNEGSFELLTYPSDNYVEESLVSGFETFLLIAEQFNNYFTLGKYSSLNTLQAKLENLKNSTDSN